MKILFLANVPSPYRVDFFNELGKYCDLTVIFEKRTSDERDLSWGKYKFNTFKGIIMKGRSFRTDAAFCPEIIKYVKNKKFDYIICTTFTDPSGMLAIQYMKMHHIPYYLECDGGFAKNGIGLKEKIKRYFISGARGYFSTGKLCDEYYLNYGASSKRIIRYPFTSLHEKDILKKLISDDEKEDIRNELNIYENRVILAVGQFIPRKGFDVLLAAMEYIPSNVGVYFVGGDPTEEYLNMKKRLDLVNVHFIGFKSKMELAKYYKAADVFVLPTREDIWGLVIQEAMGYGLQIISTVNCAAAHEMVENGKNGYIVSVENPKILAENILNVLRDEDKRKQFCVESLKQIRKYTIEEMARYHLTKFNSKSEKM